MKEIDPAAHESQPLDDGRARLTERGLALDCFLCGKKGDMSAMCKCEDQFGFPLYCHPRCLGGRSPADIEFRYRMAVYDLANNQLRKIVA